MSPTDQPSGVHVKDVPRPPDKAVVTDELQASGQAEAAADKRANKDAKVRSNDQDSAAGKSPGDDSQTQQPSRRDRHAEKRIRKLNRRLAAERDRNNANERRIATLEQELDGLKKRPAASAAPEPELKDFKSPQEFAKAYSKWGREQEAAKAANPATTREASQPARTDAGKTDSRRAEHADEDDLKEFYAQGKKKLGDEFLEAREAAIDGEFAVNRVMGDFILDSEFGAEIFVYLADNPEVSRRIYDKSETFAVKALRKLAAKAKDGKLLDSDPDETDDDDDPGDAGEDEEADKGAKSDKAKGGKAKSDEGPESGGRKATKAPKPPESGSDRGDSNARVDLESADMDAYAAERVKQLEARRRH